MIQLKVVVGVALVGLVVMLALAWALSAAAPARATEDDLGQLISELWDRVLAEQTGETSSTFNFTIEFTGSLSGIGSSVTMGQGLNNQRIARVGADFVCIARVFSRALSNDCVPFTNIAKINYREEQ